MKRIFVAGAYNGNDVISILDNMKNGMREATELFLEGFAPFVPWFDFHFQLMLRKGEKLTLQNYYDYSLSWLLVSDAVYVVPGWEKSKGTLGEITIAKESGIPLFFDKQKLKKYFKTRKTNEDK